MSVWQDPNYFQYWVSRLNHFSVYEEIKQEILTDIAKISDGLRLSYYDVGGGNGRIGLGDVLDFQTSIDITKDWESQGINKEVDICFCVLTLICLDDQNVDFVLSQMKKFSTKAIYIYEEKPTLDTICGDCIDKDHQKYSHFWGNHLKKAGFKEFSIEDSVTKPNVWQKITINL